MLTRISWTYPLHTSWVFSSLSVTVRTNLRLLLVDSEYTVPVNVCTRSWREDRYLLYTVSPQNPTPELLCLCVVSRSPLRPAACADSWEARRDRWRRSLSLTVMVCWQLLSGENSVREFRGELSRFPIFRVSYLVLTSSKMPRTSFRIHAAPTAAFNIDVNLGDEDVGK
jgi:hypothetical protein